MLQLSKFNSGQKVRISRIDGGQGLNQKLAALGILPGEVVEVMKNNHPGPFIVKVKQSNIAIGRGMAAKIMVSECK